MRLRRELLMIWLAMTLGAAAFAWRTTSVNRALDDYNRTIGELVDRIIELQQWSKTHSHTSSGDGEK